MAQTMVLFFFSGTGNTWWCAATFAREAAASGLQVECISLEAVKSNVAHTRIQEADLLGLAYPVYGSDAPEPVHQFVQSLAPVDTEAAPQRALVFCTQYLWSGDGAAVGADLLTERGFPVIWTQHILMPNNVCLPIQPKLPFTNDLGRLGGKLRRARTKLRHLAVRVAQGRPLHHGRSLGARLLGRLQREPYRRLQPTLRTVLAIDHDICIHCGLCLEICPVSNIADFGGSLMMQGQCVFCLRCYNFCPVAAITAAGRHHEQRRGTPYRGPCPNFDPRILRQSHPG